MPQCKIYYPHPPIWHDNIFYIYTILTSNTLKNIYKFIIKCLKIYVEIKSNESWSIEIKVFSPKQKEIKAIIWLIISIYII